MLRERRQVFAVDRAAAAPDTSTTLMRYSRSWRNVPGSQARPGRGAWPSRPERPRRPVRTRQAAAPLSPAARAITSPEARAPCLRSHPETACRDSADLKQPALILAGVGERASAMAEQLALEQRLGNRRTIHRDEWTVRSRAVSMQRPSQQLLPGPALTDEQDGSVVPRGAIDQRHDLLHGLRLSQDACDFRTHTSI